MSDARTLTCSSGGDELLRIGQTLRSAVSEGLIHRHRTPTGLSLRFRRSPGGAAEQALHEFVQRERKCCPFFEFIVTEHQDDLSLEIVGPPEANALLDLLFQVAEPPVAQI